MLIEDLLARLMAERYRLLLDQWLRPSSVGVHYLAVRCLSTVPAALPLHLLLKLPVHLSEEVHLSKLLPCDFVLLPDLLLQVLDIDRQDLNLSPQLCNL